MKNEQSSTAKAKSPTVLIPAALKKALVGSQRQKLFLKSFRRRIARNTRFGSLMPKSRRRFSGAWKK
jgi:hypothetical protein